MPEMGGVKRKHVGCHVVCRQPMGEALCAVNGGGLQGSTWEVTWSACSQWGRPCVPEMGDKEKHVGGHVVCMQPMGEALCAGNRGVMGKHMGGHVVCMQPMGAALCAVNGG